MDVWRVNLRERSLKREPVPETWERLGGRGLSARILLDEVPATCEPLGRHNKLVLAPGLIVGHMLSSCDRLSFGAKSPMTRGIKEANAGGSTGLHMTNLGMKALILEDQCATDGAARSGWWVLHLSLAGARFEPADDVAGLGVHDDGASASQAVRGQGGHRADRAGRARCCSSAAGIQNLDKDRVPSRIAARGGLGAVMGSKRLKAIVFDDAGGKKPAIANREAFKAAQKLFTNNTLAHPQTKTYQEYGTPAMVRTCNAFGGLPTRNFSSGQFEGAETISGETMRDLLLKRGGESETTHACMAGCVIQCSNTYGGEDGKAIVSPLEYETIGLLGIESGDRRPGHHRPAELGGERPRAGHH